MYKVYKITDGEKVYYGSTKCSLKKRLSNHKKEKHECVTNNFNRDNLNIELVEEVEDKEQVLWRERWYIENNECANKVMPILTDEERKEYCINYNKINADKIKHNNNRPYRCECGWAGTHKNKKAHLISKKHLAYLSVNKKIPILPINI